MCSIFVLKHCECACDIAHIRSASDDVVAD